VVAAVDPPSLIDTKTSATMMRYAMATPRERLRPRVAAAQAPRRLGTIMVAWKDAREPARALTAAIPLLIEAERVVVAEILEGHPSANDAATVAAQLRWHSVRAEPRTIRADGHPVAALLSSAAEACSADLLVMGSYSTGPMREEIFGGCTRSILNHAPVPVFVL
jgi:nucleotide-binding universal stress UspA family protein